MLERGVMQWNDIYPNRATAAEAAERGDLFLLVEDGAAGDTVIGTVVLNEIAAPQYDAIAWQCPEPVMIIHALAIDPRRHGGGLGRAAVEACEAFARQHGFATIRLDAYPGNPAAIALYARLGYALRGHVEFDNKPPGHTSYAVYEKRM